MLKNRNDLLINEQECKLIECICGDNETGNHLLGRKRPEGYWAMRNEIHNSSVAIERTKRQEQILEYVKQCSDYSYWKNLPNEKKLFLDVEENETTETLNEESFDKKEYNEVYEGTVISINNSFAVVKYINHQGVEKLINVKPNFHLNDSVYITISKII